MPASIFNGDAVKILKNKLRFKDGVEITSTEASYLAGTTSDIQTQIDAKKANVTSSDTTEGDLDDKIVSGLGIIKTILNPGGNEQLELELGPHYLALASTGLYSGAALSIGATTGTFDIAAGEGLFVDSTTDFSNIAVQGVTISARTNIVITNILTQPVTYISIDKDDNIIQRTSFPTPTQKRSDIFIGVVVHSDNINVNVVNNLPDVALDVTAQVHDVMLGLGFFNLSGNRITANGANLSMDKSSGKAFKQGANFQTLNTDPHTLTLGTQAALTFRYRNQDSTEGSDITVLDPTTYDNAGTTTTVPSNNNATIQRIYIFPSGAVRTQRGQEVFSNFSDAVDAVGKESFVVETNIEENGLLLASIVMKKNASDLTDGSEALIFVASRFGELGSVGSSAVGTLQQSYDNSTTPEVVLNSTAGALSVRDNSTPIAAALLEVQNNAGSTDYLSVDTQGIKGDGITASRALASDSNGAVKSTAVTSAELGFISGVTSSVQTQLNSKAVIGDVFNITSSSGVFTATVNQTHLVDTSGGVATVTLPAVSANRFVRIKDKGNANTNNITVNTLGAETIDGASSDVIDSDFGSIVYVSDGTNWFKL